MVYVTFSRRDANIAFLIQLLCGQNRNKECISGEPLFWFTDTGHLLLRPTLKKGQHAMLANPAFRPCIVLNFIYDQENLTLPSCSRDKFLVMGHRKKIIKVHGENVEHFASRFGSRSTGDQVRRTGTDRH